MHTSPTLFKAHRWLLGGLAAIACGVSAQAATQSSIHAPALIQKAAVDFAFATTQTGDPTVRPEVRPGRMDPRLRLRQCTVPLETFRTRGSRSIGRITIGVRCVAPQVWTVYVPLTVALPGDVLVATRYLQRGTVMTQADIRFERRDLATLHNGYLITPADVLGKRLKRTLRPGHVIAPGTLAAQQLVRRGTRVTIIARDRGLVIRASGKALRDGARGDIVQVRNLVTKRLVEGTVGGAGIVNVGM